MRSVRSRQTRVVGEVKNITFNDRNFRREFTSRPQDASRATLGREARYKGTLNERAGTYRTDSEHGRSRGVHRPAASCRLAPSRTSRFVICCEFCPATMTRRSISSIDGREAICIY